MATTTSQINEIKEDLSDAYTALGNKGATLPAANARGTSNLASTVATIPAADPMNKVFVVESGVGKKPTGSFSADTFAGITSIAQKGFSHAFYEYYGLTGSVSFPNLTSIGIFGCIMAFYGCSGLTSVSFPELTSISNYGINNMFEGCSGLTSVSFPKLKTISKEAFDAAFASCSHITSVSFPGLTSIDSKALGNDSNTTTYCFRGCSALTAIHFPEAMKSAVEAMNGYASKWGATNATIYFDL